MLFPVIVLVSGVLLVVESSCKKEVEIPVLTTTAISDTTLTSAKSGGSILSDGGGTITARGVCWGTDPNPAIESDTTSDGLDGSSFVSNITGLTFNTTYYLRAYATNSAGTGYGETRTFKTKSTVTDIDGNVYNVISIGSQIWMAENLKVSRYNDGSAIELVTENYYWPSNSSPFYCWFNNDPANKNPYGAMYNWYAVNTGKLCPEGWHVPTDSEWTTLTDYLGGLSSAAVKLKETGNSHWNSPNDDATNESKFSAVPGGYRRYSDGAYFSLRDNGTYWSSTAHNGTEAWSRAITIYGNTAVQVISNTMSYGISVRCIKDQDKK